MTLDEAIQKTFEKYERALAGEKTAWDEPCYLCRYDEQQDQDSKCDFCPLQGRCSKGFYPTFGWIAHFYKYPKAWEEIEEDWPMLQHCPRKTHKAKVKWLLQKRYSEINVLLKED